MASNGRMQRVAVILVVGVLQVGCGESETADSTPSISNFRISPTEALLNEGGGSVDVTGSFDFVDPGGDLATFHITSSAGDSAAVPITGAAGHSSGTIEGAFVVNTTILGHFTFEIYVTDSHGNRSNSLSGAFDVRPDDTGTSWTSRSIPIPPGSTDFRLSRVRWLQSRFLAVGSGTLTSTDGISWTSVPTGPLADVTWTGTQFVAVHYPEALTSPDGVVWTPHALPAVEGGSLSGVTSSGTTVVAVGSRRLPGTADPWTLILTSADGAGWTEVPDAYPGELRAVVWSGNRFVAVGVALGGPLAEALAVTSTDGVTWTEHRLPQLNFLQDVAWSGSRLVAVGYPGAVTSTDGITWQATGAGVAGLGNSIAWSGHRFLSCWTMYCASSTDGLQWVNTTTPPGATINGLAWGANRWAAVATAGLTPLIYTSP